jgi:hypothetical protein
MGTQIGNSFGQISGIQGAGVGQPGAGGSPFAPPQPYTPINLTKAGIVQP